MGVVPLNRGWLIRRLCSYYEFDSLLWRFVYLPRVWWWQRQLKIDYLQTRASPPLRVVTRRFRMSDLFICISLRMILPEAFSLLTTPIGHCVQPQTLRMAGWKCTTHSVMAQCLMWFSPSLSTILLSRIIGPYKYMFWLFFLLSFFLT